MKKYFIILFGLFFLFTYSPISYAQESQEESIKVRIIKIGACLQNNNEEEKNDHCKQLTLKALSGSVKGKTFLHETTFATIGEVETGYHISDTYYATYFPEKAEGESKISLGEIDRTNGLLLLVFLFMAVVLWYGRKQGAMSLLSLGINMLVLIFGIANGVFHNVPPLLLIFGGGVAIMFFSLFVTYGFNTKSLSAFLGSLFGIIITVVLTNISLSMLHMTGYASEEAGFLSGMLGNTSILDILFIGIIIGMLGVLDDITIGQSSTAFQIAEANPRLSWKEIYKKTIIVGKDHVASMVNTLIIAYAGASFPLFLLLVKDPGSDILSIINMEIIAEEVMRMLVGSIGFILTVPITTYIASRFACNKYNVNKHLHGI